MNEKDNVNNIIEGTVDKIENQNQLFTENLVQKKSTNKIFNTIVLLSIPVTIFLFFSIIQNSTPGDLGSGLLLVMLVPPATIFYLVYFGILFVRYSKEKGDMDIMDKITFYILLFPFIALVFFIFRYVYENHDEVWKTVTEINHPVIDTSDYEKLRPVITKSVTGFCIKKEVTRYYMDANGSMIYDSMEECVKDGGKKTSL